MAWLDTDGQLDILGLPHGSPVSFIDNHMVVGAGLGKLRGMAGLGLVMWSGHARGDYDLQTGIPTGMSESDQADFLSEQAATGLSWNGTNWVTPAEVAAAVKEQTTFAAAKASLERLPGWVVPSAIVSAIGILGLALWKRSRRSKKK